MENLDVARTLTELADLLEIQGASPFRIRAYRNAVNTINSLSRPLKDMVAAGEDLTELPGVGKSVAKYIGEFLTSGSISRLEEVSAEFPRSLVQLMRLDGVGPKKARKLFEELDVRTVDDLAAELEAGRVQTLDGFGVKSAAKILDAIEDHKKHTGRFQIRETERLIAGLLEHMQSAPGVARIELAGSLRRRKETIGDVDILVVNRDGPARLYRNLASSSSGASRWIGFHLLNEQGSEALGAKVTATLAWNDPDLEERLIQRTARASSSYLASNDPRIHIGLESPGLAKNVQVTWSDGATESFGDLPSGTYHRLIRNEGL